MQSYRLLAQFLRLKRELIMGKVQINYAKLLTTKMSENKRRLTDIISPFELM